MESAIAGVILTGIGRLITSLAVQVPWGRALEGFCHDSLPFPFVGTTLSAFLFGLFVPFPINLRFKKNQAIARAVDSRNDPLVSLLYKAANSLNPVTVTLDSRKVYEGIVLRAPNLERENLHLGLLPLRSGYRDAKTLRTHFWVVDYGAFYNKSDRVNATEESDEPDANDFAIVIPLDHVTSVRFVGPDFDAHSFPKKGPFKTDRVESPPGE